MTLYLEMESFSNAFLERHSKVLEGYSRRPNSFHQWSRRWEYPFAYSHINQCISRLHQMRPGSDVSILDAGSGCTFFPYFISHKHHDAVVSCCDRSTSLAPVFEKITRRENARVKFRSCDIADTGYEDNSFDIVYCISVLEHIANYEDVIRQFRRILKAEGLLVLTFDVSLDNKAQVSLDVAKDILEKLENSFRFESTRSLSRAFADIQNSEILSTKYIRKHSEELLPWKLTWQFSLLQLGNLKVPRKPFYNLTVFCGVWRKV